MKTILSILFLLSCLTLSAQEIISQDQRVIQRDTLFFLEETTVRENGTAFPDTLVNTYLIGDSTTTANKLFDVGLQPMIQVADGMKQALQRQQATQQFNAVNPLFQSLTGNVLILETARRYFDRLSGRYRVFDQAGNNFFANLVQLPNGTLRLQEEGGPGNYVVQALGPDAFRLIDFDHDASGTGDNWWFFWDGVSAERKMYFPTERISGSTTIFRIVKVE